ncbi:MAG: hypothetical protein ACREBC_22850, partial [Pyrinomonadaceae bacterium]
MLVAFCVQGQDREQKVFDVVPEPLRARLVERLKLYVEYERGRDYDKLYDLLAESTIGRIYRDQSRAEFIAASQRGDAKGTSVRLLEFTPTNIIKTTSIFAKENADLYNSYGDAKLCQQGELVEKQV